MKPIRPPNYWKDYRARKAAMLTPTSDKVERKQAPCIHENAGSNGKCNQPGIERQTAGPILVLCYTHRYCYGGTFPVHGETQSPYEGVPVVYPKA